MPVTARLSKRFYDAVGEDVANEMVDWFNAVDTTYKADLRDLIEWMFLFWLGTVAATLAGVLTR